MAKKKGGKKGPAVVVAPQKDDKGIVGTMATTAAIGATAGLAMAGTSAAINAVTGPDTPPPAETIEAAPATPEQVGLTPEQMQQLEQLAALKEQGILTQAEFDAQKAQILATTVNSPAAEAAAPPPA